VEKWAKVHMPWCQDIFERKGRQSKIDNKALALGDLRSLNLLTLAKWREK
jgi:hypothetical protein